MNETLIWILLDEYSDRQKKEQTNESESKTEYQIPKPDIDIQIERHIKLHCGQVELLKFHHALQLKRHKTAHHIIDLRD